MSSAGIYASSHQWPLTEESPIDPSSRHIGKVETENWLRQEGIPFTSFRPTYIYGPGNYNPIESWFFDRIVHNKSVPMPGDGSTITQLGHVRDLAGAMARSLDIDKAINQVYNCSGSSGITFLGLIHAAAIACGKSPQDIDIRPFEPSGLDPKARKAFPLRISHFLTDITKVKTDLAWYPETDLQKGLKDSFENDYLLNSNKEPDFTSDQLLIGT